MNTPIVFLDMDGVLVTHGSLQSAATRRAEERANELARAGKWVPRNAAHADYHKAMMAPEAVAQLERLCAETGAAVVVSSSWRRAYWPDMRGWLRDAGLSAPVIDRTPVKEWRTSPAGSALAAAPRGAEIAAWRESAGHVGPYVVLDDDSDAGEGHGGRFVQCDFEHGLTAERADVAIRALMGDAP